MIQCKVLKQLENLEQQKYDDEDISEDIKFLLEKLGESVQDLRYVIFNSQRLDILDFDLSGILWKFKFLTKYKLKRFY